MTNDNLSNSSLQVQSSSNPPPQTVSVFDLPEFPQSTFAPNKHYFTPAQIKSALDEYRDTATDIKTIIEKKGLNWGGFWKLCQMQPEVLAYYHNSRTLKAHSHDEKAENAVYTVPSPQEEPALYQADRDGNMCLSMAGARIIEFRWKHSKDRALYCETGTRVQRTQVDQRSLSVRVNVTPGQLPATARELGSTSLDTLMQGLGSQLK